MHGLSPVEPGERGVRDGRTNGLSALKTRDGCMRLWIAGEVLPVNHFIARPGKILIARCFDGTNVAGEVNAYRASPFFNGFAQRAHEIGRQQVIVRLH
jgi:hypothetical protein